MVLGGGAVSHERGTPVSECILRILDVSLCLGDPPPHSSARSAGRAPDAFDHHGATVGSYGGGGSYEQGIPVKRGRCAFYTFVYQGKEGHGRPPLGELGDPDHHAGAPRS